MSETPPVLIDIYDDDEDYRLQLRIQLEAAGYRVREAADRAAAAELLDAECPALVIQDLMMEEPDTGFAMCHRLKRQHPDLPIIMITGVAAETGIDFGAATGEERSWVKADRVLAKPIRFEQLQAAINALLA